MGNGSLSYAMDQFSWYNPDDLVLQMMQHSFVMKTSMNKFFTCYFHIAIYGYQFWPTTVWLWAILLHQTCDKKPFWM